jgi:surface protein
MKTKELFKRTLLVLMALLGTLTASAAISYDFSAPNEAGQKIYYRIRNTELQRVFVTNPEVQGAYSGDVIIPSVVENNDIVYTVYGIGSDCFNHYSTSSVTLPNTIRIIESAAFANTDLSSLIIPENVTELGPRVVARTGGIVDHDTHTVNGFTLFYNAENANCGYNQFNRGIFYLGNDCEVIIGQNVEHIPDFFISGSEIQSIHIPSNVTSIGEYAFSGCTGLTSITLPSGITSIGEAAFQNCTGISTVVACMTTPPSIEANVFPNRSSQTLYVPSGCLPNYVTADYWKEFKRIEEPTRINFEDSNVEAICVQNWDTNGDGYLDQIEAYLVTDLGTAFQGKSQITKFNELQYFTSLSNIPDNAFNGCNSLTAITLPENLTTIGENAFKNCTCLPAITLSTKVNAIGSSAFMGCRSLASVSDFNKNMTIGESAFANCTNLTNLTINAATIKSNAFQGCTGLTSLNVSATTVENNAFQGCTNLATVSFNANAVESNTFQGCTHLTSVTLGNKVADIKEGAFRNCTALTGINIPGTVITISGGFEGCTSLSNVTLNSGTKYIVNSVFQGCSSLRSITLPNGLLYIGESVFEGTGLTEINIPSSVTSIQSRAFYGCDNMTKVTVNWTTPLVVPADAFPNRANQWLIVPQGTKESYQAADVWKDFKWIFQDGEVVYGINVGGVVVSDQNVADITGASITGGSVSFDPATHVLTLTDATITCSTAPGIQVTTSYVFDDLTIRLVGDNTINTTSYSPVALLCQTTITGPGSLTVKVNGNNGYIDMIGDHPLIIEGGCTIYGSDISGSNGATLKARGTDTEINLSSCIHGFGSVTLEDGLGYVVPEGGSYDTNIGYTVDSNGNKWIHGVIIKVLPYVVYDSGNTTLTFYCDSKRSTHNGATETSYLLNEGANDPGWYTDNSCGNVSTVVFDPSFAAARPTSTYWWFSFMGNLSSIEGIEYLNTSEVTNMSRMFSTCWSMESIDLSHFDTGNVTNMSYMFNYCEALTSLDLSSFDTHNVFNMEGMFYECSSLTSLDLSGFNTENVKSFKEMFFDCVGLNSMDLSNFDTRNAGTMNGMFLECSGLTSLDLSSFNTANVVDMGYMFDFCRNLETIYVGDEWSTAAVTNSSGMFSDCLSIVGGKGTTYDANHVDKAYAHVDGGPSDPGYFSSHVTFLRGDVNGDGHVSIADVSALIDYLLSGETAPAGADCNQSGNVSIADVSSLIDYLLSGQWP